MPVSRHPIPFILYSIARRLTYPRTRLSLSVRTLAGADIKEMKDKNFAEVYRSNFLGSWARVTSFRKPIVGAVSGYAVSPEPVRSIHQHSY